MSDYVLEGATWQTPTGTVTWSIAQQNYPDRNYQFSSFLPASFSTDIEAAFAKWASVAGLDLVQVPDGDASDIRLGENYIDGPYNTAAITQYSYTPSPAGPGKFLSADIEFDSGENYHLSAGHEVDAGGNSFYAVALHEIGHALGLGHYTGGPAIMNPVESVPDLTQSDIDGIQALYGPPGGPAVSDDGGTTLTQVGDRTRVDITRPDQEVSLPSSAVFINHGQGDTTFVFDPVYGRDAIFGFVAAGTGHGTIDLPQADFASIADVLHDTQSAAGGAIIHDPVSGETIRIAGVSKATLVQHRGADFALHG